MDLSGDWAFALDADKTGIEQGIFRSLPTDTITLPGTTSIAKKGTPSDKKEIGFLTDPYLLKVTHGMQKKLPWTKIPKTKIFIYIWNVHA